MTFEITANKASKWVGLQIQGSHADARAVAANVLDWDILAPITITTRCGRAMTYADFDSLPKETVPCPCGTEGEYIVEYVEAPP